MEVRQVSPGTCPRCGAGVPASGKGRPRTWCSQACRRAAYEERRAADRGAIAIEFVAPTVVDTEHDLTESCDAPASHRRLPSVLQQLAVMAKARELQHDAKWQSVLPALEALVATLTVIPRDRSTYLR